MSPQSTVELLGALTALGFSDEAFAQLHHFRLKRRKASISGHLRYCGKITSFQSGGENERVQRRLDLVLNAYQAGGFRSKDSRVFIGLADAAFHELPPLTAAAT